MPLRTEIFNMPFRAAAATGTFNLAVTTHGRLWHISVGSRSGPVMIDSVVLRMGQANPVLISYEATGRANEVIAWDGELPFDRNMSLQVTFSGANIGDLISIAALVEVAK